MSIPSCKGDCHQGRQACPHPERCQLGTAPRAGMKSTFKTPTGGEIVVEPSPAKGHVWITSRQRPDGGSTYIVAIPLHLAGIVAQALEATATVMEEACLQPELAAVAVRFAESGGLSA